MNRFTRKLISASVTGILSAGFVLASTAVPAQAAVCAHATLFASDGSGMLYKYEPDGTPIGSPVQLADTYFDLAFDSETGTFYGMRSGGQLDVINVDTGAVLRSVTAPGGANYNAASVLPGGMVAAPFNSTVVYINPSTGASTDYFDMNLIKDETGATYTGWSSAGDFITLQDGSLILLLNNYNIGSGVVVVKVTNGNGIILGLAPNSYGGARVGTSLYLSGSDGVMRKIDSLPTVAGRGNIATTTVATINGGYYGAAGTEDSEASSCSTSGRDGFTAGIDSYNGRSPDAPSIAGAVLTSAPTAVGLADTGLPVSLWAGLAALLGLTGAGLLMTRRVRRKA